MKLTISPDSFALLCFLSLMHGHSDFLDKSPDYITEKVWMLRAGYTAFAALDIYNMRRVIVYCESWGIEVPQVIAKEMALQNDSKKYLEEKGFFGL